MSEYTVDQILQAKRVAREAGYDVKLPEDRIEQAKNIAKAHGYNVQKQENPQLQQQTQPQQRVNRADISKALEVVTNAGLSVRKAMNNDNINRNPPQPAPNNGQPAPAQNRNQPAPVQSAPEKPAEPQHSWAERIASKYL